MLNSAMLNVVEWVRDWLENINMAKKGAAVKW